MIATILLGLGLLAGCGSGDDAGAPPAEASEDAQTLAQAEALATQFFTVLENGDRAELEQFLSPAFQLMRADGSTADKSQYLASPAQVESFELSDFMAGEDDDVLTTTYKAVTTETIDGQEYRKEPLPRSSTFVNTGDDQWQIVAHANLSGPADTSTDLVESSPITDPSSPDIKAAAKSLEKRALQLVTEKNSEALAPLISPGFQLLRGDGTVADRDVFLSQPPGITSYKVGGFGVTNTDQVIVARFVGTYDLEVDGKTYPAQPAPQLSVIVGQPPDLRIISIVNFNKPQS